MSNNIQLARALGLAVWILAISIGILGCQEHTSIAKTHSPEKVGAAIPKNFLRYSDSFASAGQPSEDYLKLLAKQGVDIVINVAPHSSSGALDNEQLSVSDAKMQYLNIPVIWDEPTQVDVEAFLSFMRKHPDEHIFLHCQLNMRASAFAFLHRVINLKEDPVTATSDMLSVWTPNQTWRELVNTALGHHQIAYRIEK